MSILAATELKQFVQGLAEIGDYFQERYGRQPTHTIGYRKPTNQKDYPFFAYVPALGLIGGLGGDQVMVSIILGVCEQNITDEIYDGVSVLGALSDYLIPELLAGPIGDHTTLSAPLRVIDDLGAGHPFYQREIQLSLVVHS